MRIRGIWTAILAGALLLALAPSSAVSQVVPVTFQWTAPRDGAPVDHYLVYAIRDDSEPDFLATRLDNNLTFDAELGIRYRVCVRGVSLYGRIGPMSEVSDEVYFALPNQGDSLPMSPTLRPNYPNPFNPETTIVYGVPESDNGSSRMSLEIYSMRGKRVRSLQIDPSPGWHSVNWNGRDDYGSIQPSSNYIVRFLCNGQSQSWKMTMLK